MEEELLQKQIEIRSLKEEVSNGTIKAEEARSRLEGLTAEKRSIEQRIALAQAPVSRTETRGGMDFEEIREAILNKRAISLNGTGAISQVDELLHEMQRKTRILEKVRYFRGRNAVTSIPLLSPTIAIPEPFAEGATNIPLDTQAGLVNRELRPRAFISTIPVTAETLALGSIDFERELPKIFAKAYAQAFARQVLTGDGLGLNFQGIFTDLTNTMNCQMAGTPRVMDLVSLAKEAGDFMDSAIIILSPAVYTGIMGDATPGLAEKYKEGIIRDKTVEGIPIFTTGFAPSSVVSGSTVAVACDPSEYGFALANEIRIEPIRRTDSSQTYFQSIMFANGARLIDTNFIGLRTV